MNFKRQNDDDIIEMQKLFAENPDNLKQIEYYKNLLSLIGEKMSAIDERLIKGYTFSKGTILGVIPFSKKHILDSYDISRLQFDKLEEEYRLEVNHKYLEVKFARSAQYKKTYDATVEQMNKDMEEVIKKITLLSKTRPYIENILQQYERKKETMKEETKVDFYLNFLANINDPDRYK